MNIVRSAYTFSLRLAVPLILFHLGRRARRHTGGHDDWRARLGITKPVLGNPIWVHAASTGEVQAIAPVVQALAHRYPVIVTTFTASGRERAQLLFTGIPVSLCPLDIPGAWARFFRSVDPRFIILAETELWPNLLRQANMRRVKVVIANARMTPKTHRRLLRFDGAAERLVNDLSLVLAQSETDLARFLSIGLPKDRGLVIGNLKAASVLPETELAHGRKLKSKWRAKAWVAGSIRAEEKSQLAVSVKKLMELKPNVISILVPRYPEAGPSIAQELKKHGLSPIRVQGLPEFVLDPGAIVIVEKLGILVSLYAAGDVAFVGGTFSCVGGHNVVEPALLGLPVLVGPNTSNVSESISILRESHGLLQVESGQALAESLARLLSDDPLRIGMGKRAHSAAANQRTLERTLSLLDGYLDAINVPSKA